MARLPCEIVWATSWLADANDVLAPLLGLPELRFVTWPDEDDEDERLHWKTRGLVDWAAGRPFVWVDDEITEPDRAWVAAQHPDDALLRHVDARHGLTEADRAAIDDWLHRRTPRPPDTDARG